MLQYEYCSLATLEDIERDWKMKSSEGLSVTFPNIALGQQFL